MKVEIRCPDCQNACLVDESVRSGELLCPKCLTRISLDRPAEAPPRQPVATAPPPAPATGSVAPRQSPAPQAPVSPPVARVESRPAGPQPVVCPRCKLHFTVGADEKPPEPERRRRVLVVEDLEYFREVAKDALGAKYEVTTASTAQEARVALARGCVDLLILDLTLEGGELAGRMLLGELRPKPCPILIYTAKDESEMYGDPWDELVRLGADDLVIKGMNVGESLVRKVDQLLGEGLVEEDAFV